MTGDKTWMRKAWFESILSDVKYKDWAFHVEVRSRVVDAAKGLYASDYYMQVRFPDADLVTGEVETQHGRKWILSEHMKKSEVVTTAFKAIITAEEHEIREKFRYRGRMIFGPHIDVDALHDACRTLDLRDDPKTVAVD